MSPTVNEREGRVGEMIEATGLGWSRVVGGTRDKQTVKLDHSDTQGGGGGEHSESM